MTLLLILYNIAYIDKDAINEACYKLKSFDIIAIPVPMNEWNELIKVVEVLNVKG